MTTTPIQLLRSLFKGLATFGCFPLLLIHANSVGADYASLLRSFVHADGVDYASWADDPQAMHQLDSVLTAMGDTRVEALNEEEQKAFYINLYNAAMLQAVLEAYPVDSVTAMRPDFGIFKEKRISVGDQHLSLDDVEKGILLKRWPDPRIHFAVNCASRSCPPLRNEPYAADRLDEQLDEQARQFANSTEAVQVEENTRTLHISSLFDWYASDFRAASIAGYLNHYRSKPLPEKWKVQYLPYDWSLNQSTPSH